MGELDRALTKRLDAPCADPRSARDDGYSTGSAHQVSSGKTRNGGNGGQGPAATIRATRSGTIHYPLSTIHFSVKWNGGGDTTWAAPTTIRANQPVAETADRGPPLRSVRHAPALSTIHFSAAERRTGARRFDLHDALRHHPLPHYPLSTFCNGGAQSKIQIPEIQNRPTAQFPFRPAADSACRGRSGPFCWLGRILGEPPRFGRSLRAGCPTGRDTCSSKGRGRWPGARI